MILVGDPPAEGVAPGDSEQSPGLILDMVRAANGAGAAPLPRPSPRFFGDDGVLLKKFVFRVEPSEGLKKIEPWSSAWSRPPARAWSSSSSSTSWCPSCSSWCSSSGSCALVPGAGRRRDPGAGPRSRPRGRRPRGASRASPSWATRRTRPPPHLPAPRPRPHRGGARRRGGRAATEQLLPLGLDDLRRTLEAFSDEGYEGREDLRPEPRLHGEEPRARRRRSASSPPPSSSAAGSPPSTSCAPRPTCSPTSPCARSSPSPGSSSWATARAAQRKELQPAAALAIGRYGFLVKDVAKGGRKDVKLVLYYDRVPSLLALKTILPDAFQRVFRLRRSSQRSSPSGGVASHARECQRSSSSAIRLRPRSR